jgi:transposase
MSLTEESVRSVYAQGEEAVIALVLVLAEQIAAQAREIAELKERLNKNSRNSHKPPSSDGLRRPTVSSRERSGRPSGGQVGHPGKTLTMVASPDRVVAHEPVVCAGCQAALEGLPGEVAERRQVFELPEKLYEVIEHQALAVTCPHCQTTTRGAFPAEVSQPVQYGPGMKGLMVYLQNYQLLPYERSAELIEDVVGLGLSEGTLDNARQACAAGLAEVEAGTKAAIVAAEVVGFDETGTRLAGKTAWLHTASTPELTYYQVHGQRGTEAMDAIGILPVFGGTAVRDSLASYAQYPARHALCNAHHLRELKAFAQQGQAWAAEMRGLLCEIKRAVEKAQARGASHLSEHQLDRFTKRYRRLITKGRRANPIPMRPLGHGRLKRPPVNNLLNRLADQEAAVLLFMHDFQVPFDNNQSERDLRMMKVKQKVSGCFRSPEGAADFCRIRAYISTLRKQGLPVLDSLRSVFTGKPRAPALG